MRFQRHERKVTDVTEATALEKYDYLGCRGRLDASRPDNPRLMTGGLLLQ
jgi:hypothetical protein